MRRVLVYKCGESNPAVMGELGCYERFLARALAEVAEADDAPVALEVHRGFAEPRHPLRHGDGRGHGYDGLWLSGSPRSLVEPEPWMADAQAFVREVAAREIPILGVCFGHQLVAQAFGGAVRQNPAGWEAGTRRVRLTDAGRRDPLFAGVADEEGWLVVNQSHRDEVDPAPPGALVLAESPRSAVQALAIGDHVRSLQFHPEFDGEVMRRLLRSRAATLDADAEAQGRLPSEGAGRLWQEARDTPVAQRILRNWLRAYVARSS